MQLQKCQVFSANARDQFVDIGFAYLDWLSIFLCFLIFLLISWFALVVFYSNRYGIYQLICEVPFHLNSIWKWKGLFALENEVDVREVKNQRSRSLFNYGKRRRWPKKDALGFCLPGVQGIASSIARPNVKAHNVNL